MLTRVLARRVFSSVSKGRGAETSRGPPAVAPREDGDGVSTTNSTPDNGGTLTAPKPAPTADEPITVLTGIQPTGIPHIGNYFGAIKPWLELQKKYASDSSVTFYLFLADLHSLSCGPVPADVIRGNAFHLTATLLACGVDPARTVLYRQSAIPEIPQLSWMLSSLVSESKLKRLPQYKDKAKDFARSGVPLGLLCYPVLQAADVLAFKATHVPVGADQAQHMNLMTDIALIFNTAHECSLFPVPKAEFSSVPRIRSLRAPQQKMSKSESSPRGRIDMIDDAETILDKCRKAQTDSINEVTYNPGQRLAIANLIDMLAAIRGVDAEEVMKEAAAWNSLQLKEALAMEVEGLVGPVRERYKEIVKHKEEVYRVLAAGEERARAVASDTVREALRIQGFRR